MRIGLIGAGNMARGLARGWGEPVLCADPVRERAEELAAETGGEALGSNTEVAQNADVVVLCHKPPQLDAVAEEIAPHVKTVVSILASTPLAAIQQAYPDRPVYRVLPNTPVELRQGVVVIANAPPQEPDAQIEELLGRLGLLVHLDDGQIDAAMALMSNAPAYVALVAEAQIDAGVRKGIPAAQGAELVVQTLAGTAELLRRRGYDTASVRREVTSPGGLTARGRDALDAVLEPR